MAYGLSNGHVTDDVIGLLLYTTMYILRYVYVNVYGSQRRLQRIMHGARS